jgi:hypothetical protein
MFFKGLSYFFHFRYSVSASLTVLFRSKVNIDYHHITLCKFHELVSSIIQFINDFSRMSSNPIAKVQLLIIFDRKVKFKLFIIIPVENNTT